MARVKLNKNAKDSIRKASRTRIADYFIGLPAHVKGSKWIRATNRYRVECVKTYGDDSRSGLVDHGQLTQYIAASAPTHVIDGWSLLGRSIECSLRGDLYSSIHFSYYAELRAAMGLLASEGIGILDNRHPVVEDSGATAPLPKVQIWDYAAGGYNNQRARTHVIIGPCLRQWASLKRATVLLDEFVRPDDVAFSDWLAACGAATPARAIAQDWLHSWGIDLTLIEDDRDSRNLASYRPSEFRLPAPNNITDKLDYFDELWRLFEPSPGQRFPILEQYLLRRAMRAGGVVTPSAQDIEALGLSSVSANQWSQFLAGTDDPNPMLEAEKQTSLEDPLCHLQVIARAALLLFVASSAAARTLRLAHFTRDDLAFWWQRFGETRGLWESTQVPSNPADCWADIRASLDDCRLWRTGVPHSVSLRKWRRDQPHVLDDFGAWEIVAIWGLVA